MMSHAYACPIYVFTRYVFHFRITFSNLFFLWILFDSMSVFLFHCLCVLCVDAEDHVGNKCYPFNMLSFGLCLLSTNPKINQSINQSINQMT